MFPKSLEKRPGVLNILETLGRTLKVRVVDAKNKPKPDVAVKVFKIEKEPITPEQWTENLRNGAPFKRLISSINTDSNGEATAEFPVGTYEVVVEKCSFRQLCELTQNVDVSVGEHKKHWWQ